GRADRPHQLGAIGRACALEAIGGDEKRLESEADIEAFYREAIAGMRRLERRFQRLAHRRLRIGPRQIVDRIIRERPERLKELLVVKSRRAWRDDPFRLEALAHHVAHELDG